MKSRVYLVTGAAGNLGSSVCRQLLSQDAKIRALVLQGDPAAERVPEEVEIVIGDVTDTASLERFFTVEEGMEVIVIHCASIVSIAGDYSKLLYDVNVGGTKNIVDKCIEHKVKKLVYISSTTAIPELPSGQEITEVDHFSPEGIVGHYGKSKAIATQVVMDAAQQQGLDASIVFPSGICGPNDYAYGPVARFIIDFVNGKITTGVAGSFNAVDVRDLADGIIVCCDKGRKGESYIMGNICISMEDMFHLISQISGVKEMRAFLPIPFAYALARICDFGSKITRKHIPLTVFSVYNLARNNNYSSEKAQRDLGYHTRAFKETIADTIRWLREEGRIPQAKVTTPPFLVG